MSKKNRKNDAPDEEVVEETVEEVVEEAVEEPVEAAPEIPAEEPAVEAVEENIAVSEEPAAIEPTEEIKTEEASAPAPEAPPAGPNAKAGTVTKPVNFRTGPSFNNAVIVELKAGSKLVLDGTVEGDKGTWYKCEFDGRTGYVKATGIIVM